MDASGQKEEQSWQSITECYEEHRDQRAFRNAKSIKNDEAE